MVLSRGALLRSIAAVLAGLATESCEPAQSPPEIAGSLQRPISLFARPWPWTDEQGASVTFSQWRGVPIVVSAVYTTCTRTCPLTVEKLRAVHDVFVGAGRTAQFALVTLDPSVDTPERLRQFKNSRKLPASWHLLNGGKDQTLDLMDLMGIHTMDMDSHVFHDSRILVFDERGILARKFACCDFDAKEALL